MTPAVPTVMAKGTNFFYARAYLEGKYGAGVWKDVLESMPEGARNVWKQPLLVSKEYPFGAFKEMIATLTRILRAPKDAELAAIYEEIADQSLNKLYKVFFRLANPSFAIKNYPSLWSMLFNAGTVEVPVAEKGHTVVRFLLPEIFEDWLKPACLGFSKKAVEMAGGADLVMQRKNHERTPEGLWETVYELSWKE